MILNYSISGSYLLPKGSVLNDNNSITLPNGDFIKLWTAVELNDDVDLHELQLNTRGIYTSFDRERHLELTDD